MATQPMHTFCRICEPGCPIIADRDGQRGVVSLRPSREHPSGGVACHKGLSFLDVHRDPDRLDRPWRRANPRSQARGEFVPVDWSVAIEQIAVRLQDLRSRFGPDAVAVYSGNPGVFNSAGMIAEGAFQRMLGTRMRFNANTQDTSNKFVGAAAVYGSPMALTVPDLEHTDYLLVIGSNPAVSRWTLVSAPQREDTLGNIRARGGQVRFVNPRITESSHAGTGPTLQIRPGTDVYFLAAVLHEIERTRGFEQGPMARWGRNVDGLRRFVRTWPPARVAAVTGLSADAIETVARELLQARSAAVHMSTGVNQSGQGVLCHWLVEMIQLASGNLGRRGGTIKPAGLMPQLPPVGPMVEVDTPAGRLPLTATAGPVALPGVLLPDLIDNGSIRALIVLSGNPLLSIGGEARLRLAFERLDLMVSVDIYRNATGELCDFVLPATDWLERPDINLVASGLQIRPHVQYTDAMVAPSGQRRHEAWILGRLMQAMGHPGPFGVSAEPDEGELQRVFDGLLAAQGLSVAGLKALPHQTALLPELPPESLYERCVRHPDGRIDCCPSAFEDAGLLSRYERIFEELQEAPAGLRLISLRTTHMHNSWFANVDRFRQGRHGESALLMSDIDASRLGLHEQDRVTVGTAWGEIETDLQIDPCLREGVVALTHGGGHAQAFGLQVASSRPGLNVNRLMPHDRFEPLSHMSWLTGVPVDVRRRVDAATSCSLIEKVSKN